MNGSTPSMTRTWEVRKLLTTVIENGTQYFNISGGYSAEDDLILCTDTTRFSFELDTTAAQALIMQGEATAEGIRLTWTQDDFDTLMGYNVYRSDSEDGYYQRVNEITIPADTKTFFDDTVEPGVVYYYNFTVVKTDLSESAPSGKITIQALDTMAPNIYHTPVYTAKTGANLVITATDPTCTESGHTTHTCTRCGDSFRDGHRDPLGHDWSGTVCRRCGEIRQNPFVDVPEGSFYYEPVIWAVRSGITNGLSATAFGPNAICNRAQIVTFLYRAFA